MRIGNPATKLVLPFTLTTPLPAAKNPHSRIELG
jgi:hypothetical protein